MQSGREQLAEWIDRRFPNASAKQTVAAAFLEVDRTYLSQLLAGKRKPGLPTSVRIEQLTGISVESWLPQWDDPQSEADPVAAHNSASGNE